MPQFVDLSSSLIPWKNIVAWSNSAWFTPAIVEARSDKIRVTEILRIEITKPPKSPRARITMIS